MRQTKAKRPLAQLAGLCESLAMGVANAIVAADPMRRENTAHDARELAHAALEIAHRLENGETLP